MKSIKPQLGASKKLRRRADRLSGRGNAENIDDLSPVRIAELVHDLETHRLELEMQNEDLRRAQNELEYMYDQYSELYENAPIGYFSTDRQDSINRSNLDFAQILEVSRSFLIDKKLSSFILPNSQDDYNKHRKNVFESSTRQSCELNMQTQNGRSIWVRLASILIDKGGDDAAEIRSVLSDITERNHLDTELRKLSRAVEFSSSAVIITNLEGNIEYVNPKFSDITGYSRDEAIGNSHHLLQSPRTPDTIHVDMWKTITAGGEWRGEMHNHRKDGSLYRARDSVSCVRDNNGVVTHYIDIHDDVSHEYELATQLNYHATHDSLTGLINRREFERRAERLFLTIEYDKHEHAMCILDLDHFKIINDTCGHAAGDELLRQLAKVQKSAVRNRDTLGRLGGDEFGVLMEHCTPDQARRSAKALLRAIQDYRFYWEGQTFRIGASIGLVGISDQMPNLTELLKQADAACYTAKDSGRNRIHVFHDEDFDLSRRHGEMQWSDRINQALTEDRLCLYAQPVRPLDRRKKRHYELLLRLKDERHKLVLPSIFLPQADRFGLASKLDLWVIKKAISVLAANPAIISKSSFISINLSGASLTSRDFLLSVVSDIKAGNVEPEKICFEITETVAISNLNAATVFISTIKDLGCRFALDDFGSGFSSFSYLKKLPVDYLKIDGMLVNNIVNNPIDHAMVKSINEIAHVMGMQTIAKIVETDEIIDRLRILGVDYTQGYCVGKPQPLGSLLETQE